MSLAFVFPGQGSQAMGMGRELADSFASARHVFQEVDDALSQKLSALMWQGDEAELNLTANTQPALMAVSLAVMAVLVKDMGLNIGAQVAAMAGHSLGEYSAYAAAGSFSVADTARLLRIRGTAMQQAVPLGQGAMAAIIGLDWDAVENVCNQAAAATGEVCVPANDNAPGQVVISGTAAAIAKAIELASAAGAKRALALNVSAPFHCPLMQPAADEMQKALAQVAIAAPAVPVWANMLAAPVTQAADIAPNLVAQVVGRVRWRESVANMAASGVTHMVEIGAGKVLSGLNKRIADGVQTSNLLLPADLEAFAKTL